VKDAQALAGSGGRIRRTTVSPVLEALGASQPVALGRQPRPPGKASPGDEVHLGVGKPERRACHSPTARTPAVLSQDFRVLTWRAHVLMRATLPLPL
jgi:hypothetical protein